MTPTRWYTEPHSQGLHSGIDVLVSGIEGYDVIASRDGKVVKVLSGCKSYNGLKSNGRDCSVSGCENPFKAYDLGINRVEYYCNDSAGNMVILEHEMKDEEGSTYYLYSQYCHLPNIIVSLNQVISQGDKIGTVGSTGMSSGPHLHFSISIGISYWGRDLINNNPYNIEAPYEPGEFEYFDESESDITVTFDLNYTATGDAAAPASKTYSSSNIPDEALPVLDDRFGYTFDGWYFGEITSDSKIMMDANHTLTARWEPKTLTVSFDSGADCGFMDPVDTILVKYGENYAGLPTPTKDGHEFIGWFFDGDGEFDGVECTRELMAIPEHPEWSLLCTQPLTM